MKGFILDKTAWLLDKCGLMTKISEYVTWERVKKWYDTNNEINKRFLIALSPKKFKPKFGGRFLYCDGNYIQIISIADPSPANPNRAGFRPRKNLRLLDDILEIPKPESATIAVTQSFYALPATDEISTMNKANKDNLLSIISQESHAEDGELKTHDSYNDYISETIKIYNKLIYEGKTRLFENSLLLAVKGKSIDDVNDLMEKVTTSIRSKRVIFEVLEDQLSVDAFKMMQLTPQIHNRFFSTTTGDIVAACCPARNPDAKFSDTGVWMWENDVTHNAILMNYEDGSLICGHDFLVGKSGDGKSTEYLKRIKRFLEEGHHVVHIVPKNDKKTDHSRVAKELKCLFIKMGIGPDCWTPNIFQIPFDKNRMDTSISGYQKAFSNYIMFLVDIVGLMASADTTPKRNWLYSALIEMYKDAFVIDNESNVINIERWDNGQPVNYFWPNFMHLKKKLWDWMHDKRYKDAIIHNVIASLYNNLKMIETNSTFDFLINNNSLRLENPGTIIDLTSLLKVSNIQDALIYYVMAIIHTKAQLVPDGMKQPITHIQVDEGSTLMKNRRMKNLIEDSYRTFRSFDVYFSTALQDLSGIPRSTLDMMKTNTDFVMLFCNMNATNIKPLVKEFHLSPNGIRRLREKGVGKALLLFDDKEIPVYNALTDDDYFKILNKVVVNGEEVNNTENVPTVQGYRLDPRVQWIKDSYGIFLKDWLLGIEKKGIIQVPGFDYELQPHPFLGSGKKTVYLKEGLFNIVPATEEEKRKGEKDRRYYKNCSDDHFIFNLLLAGELCLLPDKIKVKDVEVTIDDNYGKDQLPDIKLKVILADDSVFCIGFEIEIEKSHTETEMQNKRDNLLSEKQEGKAEFDHIIFTGSNYHWRTTIKPAVGDQNSAPRGQDLLKKILDLIEARIQEIEANKKPESLPVFTKKFDDSEENLCIEDSDETAESNLYFEEPDLINPGIPAALYKSMNTLNISEEELAGL
jgi:hypothetical protein